MDVDREGTAACGREATASIPEKHGHRVVSEIGYGQVRLPVPVEVAHHYRIRVIANRERAADRGSEASGTSAQQNRNVVAALIVDCKIRVAVSVEISHRYREGICSGGKRAAARSGEPACAVT